MKGENFMLHNGDMLLNVHSVEECVGACPMHKPSDHHMRDWPLDWRGDKGIFERLCPHRIGHPDPDSERHALEYDELVGVGVHGCDGCCSHTG